jgi:phosphatidate cytidylyltransferase
MDDTHWGGQPEAADLAAPSGSTGAWPAQPAPDPRDLSDSAGDWPTRPRGSEPPPDHGPEYGSEQQPAYGSRYGGHASSTSSYPQSDANEQPAPPPRRRGGAAPDVPRDGRGRDRNDKNDRNDKDRDRKKSRKDGGRSQPARQQRQADAPYRQPVQAPPAAAPTGTKPAAGRAGRNLPAAIGVGVTLGGVLVASLLVKKVAFVVIAAVAIVIAVKELSDALRVKDIRMPLPPVAAGAVGMLVAAYTGGAQALCAALALTVLVVLIWRMAEGQENFLRDATAGTFAAVYVPFLAGFAILMVAAPHDGPKRVLLFLILVVCSDTGGYTAGVLGGRHPMAPRISPKKSWEGLAGSLVTAAAGGAVGMHLMLHHAWWQGAVVGVAAVASATLGDLAESMIKRDLGIKDMGKLLPGHGGIMDRLDSILATAPVVWLLLTIFIPV